ncbi:MAG: hypothetical protein KatS3mg008_0570 [Acidimicrobiales bacterium]|nr:MAG: hypothetical protein KatS3mg008_0570 [Acidimicrobiales bacterium]
MRVLVDACAVRVGGGLSYARSQLAALEKVAPDLELEVLASPWNARELASSLRSRVKTLPAFDVPSRFLLEQLVLSSRRADVVYCPNNFGPLVRIRAVPVVLTLQNPNYVGRGRRLPQNRGALRRAKIALSRLSMARADRLVVISESLRDELAVDSPRLALEAVVLQSGAPGWEGPAHPPDGVPLPRRFFLSLANDYPHKRLDDCVRAWVAAHRLREGGDGEVPGLVMVGEIAPARRAALRSLVPAPLRRRLVFTGSLADRAAVRWLLENAVAAVSTSELEAHPLTPAEAGSVGCPIMLSDIPPHREVAGEHAEYFRVGDVETLGELMSNRFARRPRRWSWPVTWEENALGLARVLREVADGSRRVR